MQLFPTVLPFGVLALRRVILISALALTTSCAELQALLQAGALTPPTVTFRGAQLVRSPSRRQMSAFYCPRVAQAQLGIAASALCGGLFGAPPPAQEMTLGFDMRFAVANPNNVPLPLSEILTAVSLFPGAAQQNLGAICVRLCAPGDAACQAGRDPNACRNARGDIRTLSDFPQAVANLLVSEGLSAAAGAPLKFEAPKVLSASSLDVVARFSLTPEALIPIVEQLARQSVSELRAGRELNFNVPYRLEGTVFADAGSLGRIAAGFGPSAGEWAIPVQRLLP